MRDLERVAALWQYQASMTPETMLEEVGKLTDPIFSARMLVKVTGLPMSWILPVLNKTAKTGGRLNPSTLPDILTLSRDPRRADPALVQKVVESGTSQTLLAYLTDISQSRISRIVNGGSE